MTATRRRRLPLIPLIWLPAFAALYWYVTSRDWAHMARQYNMGHTPTAPRIKHGYHPPARCSDAPPSNGDHPHRADRSPLRRRAGGSRCAVLAVCSQRRRRARATVRWELRLGRDDLANPYRVQEAFEGIAGAIGVRWYERLWRGPEHLALEIHRLPDASIRFTIAAPQLPGGAISGPLEDLYPDVELDRSSKASPSGRGHVVRLKKRDSFVLSLQTTRNYEHAFSESLVALIVQRTRRDCRCSSS